MPLNYLTGRVSRLQVGFPGFSTAKDLTVDVAGAIGIDTQNPRAAADFPDVSIRGDIVDSVGFTGGIGYFLAQDVQGVRWVEAPPINSNAILVLDNGVIVGAGSFIGLNFDSGKDEDFLSVVPDPLNPQIAKIAYDVRWVRYNYGNNKGISTGFGDNGDYSSIPGYGTTEAVGVTSVGIGTNQPLDDFQVGIGSTGVTINGPLGLVDAEIIKAKSISVEGNLEVESLIVRPGVATLTTLDVLNEAFIPVEYVGFSSIQDANIDALFANQLLAGITTLGFGGEDVFILNDLYVQGGLGTFDGDVFVGGDLTVKGETFFNQINAVNLSVSGIATIVQAEIAVGLVTDLKVSGFSTLSDFSFNIGVGTYLELEDLDVSGVGSFGVVNSGDINVSGGLTASEIDADKGYIGILTADSIVSGAGTIGSIESDGNLTTLNDIIVGGASTFVGLGTFQDDLFVGGDLFVRGDVTFKNINGEQLLISGIGTIKELVFDSGIGTSLEVRDQITTGISTINEADIQDAAVERLTVGDAEIIGIATITEIDVDRGRVGILTGTDLSYAGIGTITEIDVDQGRVGLVTGDTLLYYEQSRINRVTFFDNYLSVNQSLRVSGLSTFVGTGTFFNDLYVGGDLYVAGELNFKQLNGENLYLTGVGTIYDLRNTVGFITNLFVEESVTGLATISSLVGSSATITDFTGQSLLIQNPFNPMPLDPTGIPGQGVIDSLLVRNLTSSNNILANDIDANFVDTDDLKAGVGTITDLEWTTAVGDDTTTNTLQVTDTATINIIDANQIDAEDANIGVATLSSLLVTGVTTFKGQVDIEDIEFVDQSVTGISSINILKFNVGYGTYLEVTDSVTGVGTIGLASITTAQVSFLDVRDEVVGASTIGVLTVTEGFAVTGFSTFVGFTTMSGDLFVDGNLTVTGFVSFTQLNADQSQIGILTVFDALDARTGVGTFKHLETVDSAVLSGVSTIGLTTFKNGDVNINRNLTVGGITTFIGNVFIEDTEFVELSVTNQANINKLFVNSGVATQFSIGVATITQSLTGIATIGDLNVTGLSTFVGLATFKGDVSIDSYLEVSKDVVVGSALTVPNLTFTDGDGQFLNIQEEVVGVSTIGFASITDEIVGTSTIFRSNIRDLAVSGLSTFIGDVLMGSNLDVVGDISGTNISIAQSVTSDTLFTRFADIEGSNTGVATIGFATITELFTEDLTVVGTSTFVGFTTMTGDLNIEGNLNVTGVVTFQQLDATQSQIGILTVFNYLDNQGDLRVVGFSTLGDFSANSGILTSIESGEIDVTGDVSIGGTLGVAGEVGFSSNFYTVGITTLASGTGIVTTGGDLYVGGNLFVYNDIVYDEIIGRNLDISGIGTIADLRVGLGSIADLRGTTLRYQTGIITSLRAEDSEVGRHIGTSVVVENITATGPSTFVGVVTTTNELFVGTNLFVGNNADIQGDIFGRNLTLELNASGTTLDFDSGQIDDLISQYILSDDLFVTGITTSVAAQINFLNVSGVTTSPIINSTLLTNSGLVTTGSLYVQGLAQVETTLLVDGNSIFNGPALFNDTVTVNDDINVTGDITFNDISGINGNFAGIVTATKLKSNFLEVNGQTAITGLATFFSGLNVRGGPLVVDNQIFANSGFVTTIQGTDLTYTDGIFLGDLQVNKDTTINQNLRVVGITTSTNLDVSAQTETSLLSVTGVGTIPILYSTNGEFKTSLKTDQLFFNTGLGTYLSVTDLNVVGVATIPTLDIEFLEADRAEIGILTVTNRTDISDTSSIFSYRLTTSGSATNVTLYDSSVYRSFEANIQVSTGSSFQSSKMHGLSDDNSTPNVLFNETSYLSNGGELAEFDVSGSAGNNVILTVTPYTVGITTYILSVTAVRV
ncbi:hypothetical protein Syn7803C17_260 [Synechococcus phage ACG-2014f]|uniref:Uncharacterized protein n=1 Tax=Synechococcus phage ACG-2014f TaxID=1493511 RepID=A0A0E3G3G7_9CAUD|nr:hypothetical protein Syn7803C17_260 [Synechococcus phage ACG-2014f]